jgi:hypothetical protein
MPPRHQLGSRGESRPRHQLDIHDKGKGRGKGKLGKRHSPRPREATSVANMMGDRPDLNSAKTQSRSCCCLSPWMANAGHPSCLKNLVKSSATRLVPTKIKTLAFSCEIWSRCLMSLPRFSKSVQTVTSWVTLWLVFNSIEPMLTWIKSCWKSAARRWTSLGQVAEKRTVCRSGRIWLTIFLIWGSKPGSRRRVVSTT